MQGAEDIAGSRVRRGLMAPAGAEPMRSMGAIILVRRRMPLALHRVSGSVSPRLDAAVLCLSPSALVWRSDRRRIECPASGALLLDAASGGEVESAAPDRCLILMMPRRLMTTLFPAWSEVRVVAASEALHATRLMATNLIAADTHFSEPQARLAGRALAEMLAATFLPLARGGIGLAPRREASLFDRAVAHVDGHLAGDLDANAQCEALHCSRSALYRAVSPAGGVDALVSQRRLTAIHHRLRDDADRRSIGAIARAHGFADPARFSRSFKRSYGVTAGALRQQRHRSKGTEGPR